MHTTTCLLIAFVLIGGTVQAYRLTAFLPESCSVFSLLFVFNHYFLLYLEVPSGRQLKCGSHELAKNTTKVRVLVISFAHGECTKVSSCVSQNTLSLILTQRLSPADRLVLSIVYQPRTCLKSPRLPSKELPLLLHTYHPSPQARYAYRPRSKGTHTSPLPRPHRELNTTDPGLPPLFA